MVKLSPDNQKTGWKAGHEYHIKNIAGFNFVHDYHITGFYVMPMCGKIQTQPGPEDKPDLGYRSRISNKTEKARPGYYSVMLDDYGIKAEVSATTRTGIQRYTFPESNDATILFDLDIPYENKAKVLGAKAAKVSNTEIEGSIQFIDQHIMGQTIWLRNDYMLHFVARFDKPFKSFGAWQGELVRDGVNEFLGKGDVGCFVRYETGEHERVNEVTEFREEEKNYNENENSSGFIHDYSIDIYVVCLGN